MLGFMDWLCGPRPRYGASFKCLTIQIFASVHLKFIKVRWSSSGVRQSLLTLVRSSSAFHLTIVKGDHRVVTPQFELV